MNNITAWFVIVQSVIGVLQFAASRNGDAVAGTFGLLDFYYNNISIAQVYFSFTLFGMILFLMLDFRRPIARIAIIMGLLVWLPDCLCPCITGCATGAVFQATIWDVTICVGICSRLSISDRP